MICLARHICRLPTKVDRVEFVARLRQQRIGRDRKEDPAAIAAGDAFAKDLEGIVREQWQMIALARHVCRLPTKAERAAFVDWMRLPRVAADDLNVDTAAREGEEFAEMLQGLVRTEWALMYPK
jgi:hypothetical protein